LNIRNRHFAVVRRLEMLRPLFGATHAYEVAQRHPEVNRQFYKAIAANGTIDSILLGKRKAFFR
jgi:hypothetical protein